MEYLVTIKKGFCADDEDCGFVSAASPIEAALNFYYYLSDFVNCETLYNCLYCVERGNVDGRILFTFDELEKHVKEKENEKVSY